MCMTALCCAGSGFCNICCAGCNKLGVATKNYAKVTYVFNAIISMAFAVIIMYILRPLATKYKWTKCEYKEAASEDCFGEVSVLRMSFSLTLYHILILLILIPRARCCGAIHDGFWPVKSLVLLGIYIGSWFINKKVFIVWGGICRASSVSFLLLQAYFLMNLAYTWNDKLLSAINGRSGETWAKGLLIAFSIISSSGSLVWLVYCYIWFWGCAIANFILIETTVFVVFFYFAAFARMCNIILRENYSIFVTSCVVPYIIYLQWTSLAS